MDSIRTPRKAALEESESMITNVILKSTRQRDQKYLEDVLSIVSDIFSLTQEAPLIWLVDFIKLSDTLYQNHPHRPISEFGVTLTVTREHMSAYLKAGSLIVPEYIIFEEITNGQLQHAPSLQTIQSIGRFFKEVDLQDHCITTLVCGKSDIINSQYSSITSRMISILM